MWHWLLYIVRWRKSGVSSQFETSYLCEMTHLSGLLVLRSTAEIVLSLARFSCCWQLNTFHVISPGQAPYLTFCGEQFRYKHHRINKMDWDSLLPIYHFKHTTVIFCRNHGLVRQRPWQFWPSSAVQWCQSQISCRTYRSEPLLQYNSAPANGASITHELIGGAAAFEVSVISPQVWISVLIDNTSLGRQSLGRS